MDFFVLNAEYRVASMLEAGVKVKHNSKDLVAFWQKFSTNILSDDIIQMFFKRLVI